MKALYVRAKGAVIGKGREVIADAALLIEDGLIAAVGRQADIAVPDGATEINDFAGQWVMPGMIDTHVHLTMPGDGSDGQSFVEQRSDLDLLLVAERNAERALAAGVTTLRDVGSRGRTVMALRDAINRGDMTGPRLLVSGPAITITGGHCHYLGGEADGVDGVRQRARQIIKSGADLIKVMGSGGGTRNVNHGKPSYSVPEMRAAVEEAHRFSRRMTVHAVCTEAIEVCVEAGVDMIEHAAFWTTGPDGRVHEFREDLVARMLEQGIYVCQTMQASYGRLKELEQKQAEGTLTAAEAQELEGRKRLFEATMETTARMYERGVRQVAGTDCGYDTNPFGPNYVTGLELAVQAGMPAWAAVEHATSLAAAAIGLDRVVGALQPGLRADFVFVNGNPLDDIKVLHDVTAVFRDGVRV